MSASRKIQRLGLPVLVFVGGLWAGGATGAEDRPADPVRDMREGKALLESSCTSCHHHLRHVNSRVLDRAGWARVVDAMLDRGAVLFPPRARERDLILDYLAAKSAFEGTCGACHPLDRALAARKSAAEWRATVRRMADLKPGSIGEAEARAIADYLAVVRPLP